MRRTPLRRRPHKDPVTPEVRTQVLVRDQMEARLRGRQDFPCVAGFLFPTESAMCSRDLTLDHVKDEPRMGKRAPSDERHLVTLCRWHHIESGWATSNRPLLRWYLRSLYENPGLSRPWASE